MIEIGMNDIVKNYGFKNILNGASFEIMTGERAAIVGRNGTGKTTLFKILSKQENADKGTVSIRRGATVGMLEQIPHLYDTSSTTREVLTEPFLPLMQAESRLHELEALMAETTDKLDELMEEYSSLQDRYTAMGGYEMEENFGKIVTGFGLAPLLDRPFNVLSGGQKTIVKLASVILMQPDILLLDEPTNHLDIKTLEWFEGFLSQYRGTVVLISHDRYFLDRVATKTILLESGCCTVFNGNYSYSLREQERLLMLEFEQYKNQQKKIAAIKAAIKRYREWGTRGDNPNFFKKVHELEKRLDKMELIEQPQMEKVPIPIRFAGERSGHDVLELKDFSLTMGETSLFENAELLLIEKEKLCLLGNNGTGKTSLIKTILGEYTDYRGEVKINPSAKIGYIPQEIRFDKDTNTVLDVFRKEYICSEGEARSILARYYFYSDNVHKRVSGLSGGEKVLLKLAALIQNQVNFLILDEPTNHIDIETREMLEDALSNYRGTLLFISHDRYFIRKIASRVVEIRDKKIERFEGSFALLDSESN